MNPRVPSNKISKTSSFSFLLQPQKRNHLIYDCGLSKRSLSLRVVYPETGFGLEEGGMVHCLHLMQRRVILAEEKKQKRKWGGRRTFSFTEFKST